MRMVAGRAAVATVKRLAARGTQFDRLEPRVRRIIDEVRRHGDRALRRYAQQLDGLAIPIRRWRAPSRHRSFTFRLLMWRPACGLSIGECRKRSTVF